MPEPHVHLDGAHQAYDLAQEAAVRGVTSDVERLRFQAQWHAIMAVAEAQPRSIEATFIGSNLGVTDAEAALYRMRDAIVSLNATRFLGDTLDQTALDADVALIRAAIR